MPGLSQAGVALGLARIAGTHIPVWGIQFQTIMMAIIICNMLAGPPLFRASIVAAGEAHSLPASMQLPKQQAHDSGGSGGGDAGGGGGSGGGAQGNGGLGSSVLVIKGAVAAAATEDAQQGLHHHVRTGGGAGGSGTPGSGS